MKLKIVIVAILIMISCKHDKKAAVESIDIAEKEVSDEMSLSDPALEVYDYNGFEKFLNMKDDKMKCITF